MPDPKINISILTSNKSNSISSMSSSGGDFTSRLTEGIQQNKPLEDIFVSLKEGFKGTGIHYHPQMYGIAIPKGIADPRTINKGIAIIVSGSPKNELERKSFEADTSKMESLFTKMGYKVLKVKTREEYVRVLEEAKLFGQDNENDSLMVYFTGHAGILKSSLVKPEDKVVEETDPITGKKRLVTELAPAGAPPEDNPNQVGVFMFENPSNLENPDYTHEANIMQPIYLASKDFDHAIAIFDTCYSGCFNTQYLTEDIQEEIPKEINEDDVYSRKADHD